MIRPVELYYSSIGRTTVFWSIVFTIDLPKDTPIKEKHHLQNCIALGSSKQF